MKKIILISLLLLYFEKNYAQDKKYSLPENGDYYSKMPYVIGKVKGNILIWENYGHGNKSIIRVYDNNMKLLKSVKASFIPYGSEVQQINFINQQDSFTIFIQYYLENSFYCSKAAFNEWGKAVSSPSRLDKIKDAEKSGLFLYRFMHSRDKKSYGLVRAITDKKNENLLCDFILFRDNDAMKKMSFTIPVSGSGYSYTPFYMDNQQNIIFGNYKNIPTGNLASILTLFKINTAEESISKVTKEEIPQKVLYTVSILVNNLTNDYDVIGLYSDTTKVAAYLYLQPDGIFLSRFISDLSSMNYSFYPFNTIDELNEFKEYDKIFTRPEILAAANNNFSVTVPVSVTRPVPPGSEDNKASKSHSPLYYQTSPSIYPTLTQTYPYPLVPAPYSLSIAQEQSMRSQLFNEWAEGLNDNTGTVNYNTGAEALNQRNQTVKAEVLPGSPGMLIFYFDQSNQLKWSFALTSKSRYQLIPEAGAANISHSRSGLEIIYPNNNFLTNNQNRLLSYIKVSNDGKIADSSQIINNSPYDVQTLKGTQIGDNEIIFPCIAKHGKLAFFKVAF